MNRTYAVAAGIAAVLVGLDVNAGYFDKATCDNSRAYAKRVFLTKQLGMSYEKYRKIEGDPPPGPAGDLVREIERGIFTNSRITSESLASEYAYSLCITWK